MKTISPPTFLLQTKSTPSSVAALFVDHLPTRAAVTAERNLLASLHGGCLAPIAALGRISNNNLQLKATVLSQDGTRRLDETHELPSDSQSLLVTAVQLATQTANALLERGAEELINAAR